MYGDWFEETTAGMQSDLDVLMCGGGFEEINAGLQSDNWCVLYAQYLLRTL